MAITMVVVVSLKWFHGTCQLVVGTWLDWFPRRSFCAFFPPPLLTDFDRIKSCPGMWKLSYFKFPDRNWFNQIIFTKVNFPSKFNNKFTLIGCQLFFCAKLCTAKVMHSAKVCTVQNYAEWKLCRVQNYAQCKIMQNYAKWKIMQSEKLCRVQNHEQRKIMRSAKLCAAQNYAQFKIMHCAELCNVKIMKIAKNMQSSKLYTLNNHTRCKSMQGARLSKVAHLCNVKHVCKGQIVHCWKVQQHSNEYSAFV